MFLEKHIKITPKTVEVYHGEAYIGSFTNLEFLHLRCRIAEKRLTGYYVLWGTERIPINVNGQLTKWQVSMLDDEEALLTKLFKLQNP